MVRHAWPALILLVKKGTEVVRFSSEHWIHANPDGRRSRNILAPLQIFQMDLTRIFFPAVYVLTAMVIHALFQPALINSDGIDIYSQAISKTYNDWHPPIMAITLSGFLEAGSSFYDSPIRNSYGRLVKGLSIQYPAVVQYGYALPVPLRLPDA
jgi:hypothetical protein